MRLKSPLLSLSNTPIVGSINTLIATLKHTGLVLGVSVFLSSPAVFAEEQAKEESKLKADVVDTDVVDADVEDEEFLGFIPKIEGEIELGYIATRGNTETNSNKSRVSLKQDFEDWRNSYQLSTLYSDEIVEINGEETKQVSAERYFASVQSDYKLLGKRSALFAFASYEEDRFSGFTYQSSFALGYSNIVKDNETAFFSYSIGPGYSLGETVATETVGRREVAGGFVRIAIDYKYQISESARFTQVLSSEISLREDENDKTKSESAISANIIGNLSMKAAYTLTNNTVVPDGIENTDSELTFSLLYIF